MDLYTDAMRYMIQLIPITKYILYNIVCVFKIFSLLYPSIIENGQRRVYLQCKNDRRRTSRCHKLYIFFLSIKRRLDWSMAVRPTVRMFVWTSRSQLLYGLDTVNLVWRYFYTSSWWSLFKMLGAVPNTHNNQFLNLSISFVSDVKKIQFADFDI